MDVGSDIHDCSVLIFLISSAVTSDAMLPSVQPRTPELVLGSLAIVADPVAPVAGVGVGMTASVTGTATGAAAEVAFAATAGPTVAGTTAAAAATGAGLAGVALKIKTTAREALRNSGAGGCGGRGQFGPQPGLELTDCASPPVGSGSLADPQPILGSVVHSERALHMRPITKLHPMHVKPASPPSRFVLLHTIKNRIAELPDALASKITSRHKS